MQNEKNIPEQAKQEMKLENMTEVTGGAQVEIKNIVQDNKQSVKIGSTLVINM